MENQKWPTCGLQDCNKPAKFSDSAGVGYCDEHQLEATRTTPTGREFLKRAKTIREFDPWWTAANIASQDPALAEKWENAGYGVYPTGGPWNPYKEGGE